MDAILTPTLHIVAPASFLFIFFGVIISQNEPVKETLTFQSPPSLPLHQMSKVRPALEILIDTLLLIPHATIFDGKKLYPPLLHVCVLQAERCVHANGFSVPTSQGCDKQTDMQTDEQDGREEQFCPLFEQKSAQKDHLTNRQNR